MFHHRAQFIRLVSDTSIVGDRNAIVFSDVFEPFLVRAPGLEKIMVTNDLQARFRKDVRKTFAEISIGKESPSQAARS